MEPEEAIYDSQKPGVGGRVDIGHPIFKRIIASRRRRPVARNKGAAPIVFELGIVNRMIVIRRLAQLVKNADAYEHRQKHNGKEAGFCFETQPVIDVKEG
ncbi:MAG: hypothetical protein BWX80_00907 [Candidatus Hydrogenedentes bacterium ADurb.Bin101]|nr:MAG: hypothetical protein BWX80_00907 [Candidatus Hydrogenedentes bacterium ADurb.Bin101]